MIIKRKVIRLGAKVSTHDGDGVVVGILHTDPVKYDILPLDGGRPRLYQTSEGTMVSNCSTMIRWMILRSASDIASG